MASNSAVQFIDTALFCTTPFELSYTNPQQKWLLRKQLIQLVQEFSSLYPSTDTFTHNDGTTVHLIYAIGNLHISHSLPPIPIQIWLHENFPIMAPIVHISSNILTNPIHRNHPFVDSSGVIASPYLLMWDQSRCNLSSLVHNLIKLFSHNHPFYRKDPSSSTHPSLFSKLEAMDRLSCTLHYDIMAMREKTDDEIQNLSALQTEMVKRGDIATSIIIGLEHERMNLKGRERELTEQADVLMGWLRVHDIRRPNDDPTVMDVEGMFEVVGKDSNLFLDKLVEEKAMEDLMYALDEAVKKGAVTFQIYIKQVRSLAREQFFIRDKLLKLNRSRFFHFLN